MRRWLPQPSFGRWFGLLLLALVSAATVYAGILVERPLSVPPEQWPIDLNLYLRVLLLFGMVILTAILIYRIASAFSLGYELDRNGLYITWLGNRAVVPLDQIQSIDIGSRARLPWNPLSMIGYHSGQRRGADGRPLHMFATRRLGRCLVIYTPDAAYAISPADTEAFVQDLEQRRNLGATKPLTSAVEPGRIFLYAFWADRTVRALLLSAAVINLAVLALIAARYPSLAPLVEMRFTASGQVAELQPRHEVVFLPLAAFGLSLINIALGLTLYRNQQLGARMLQGASVLVQILFGIAAITIVS